MVILVSFIIYNRDKIINPFFLRSIDMSKARRLSEELAILGQEDLSNKMDKIVKSQEYEEPEVYEDERQQRFEDFVKELTILSKKYGVAIRSIGGVFISMDINDMKNINYDDDSTSGDLNYKGTSLDSM